VALNSEEYSLLERYAGKLLKTKFEKLLKDKTYLEENYKANKVGRIKEIEEEARTEAIEEFKDSKYAERIKIKANEMALKKIRSEEGSNDKTNRFLDFFENQQ
jgi:hypothetical protein